VLGVFEYKACGANQCDLAAPQAFNSYRRYIHTNHVPPH